jgi:peptidyl-prolyl cis-trans isomerase B (cyclophilin B)
MENSPPMKAWNLICAISLVAGLATASAADTNTNSQATVPMAQPPATNEVAVINTTEGEMVIAFWSDAAPNTVANFKKLAEKGFYDGTCFHRIMKGFMVQGGDPLTKMPAAKAAWGSGGPGYTIKAEFNNHSHQLGVISMARSSDPNSAGSQFFICDGDASFLDHQYTAFGHLTKGVDVLQKIADTPVGPSPSGENSAPLKRVGVISIKIVPADAVKQADL